MHGKTKNGRNTSNLGKKVVEFHRLAEKDHARLKRLRHTLKAFVNFRNKQQKCKK